MRVLITGLILLAVWCFVSAWLYNDKLVPAMKKPVPIMATSNIQTTEADSLMKLKASMPKNLVIYFEFNGTKFNPDSQIDNNITPFKVWLEKYSMSMLSVTGHTDLVGPDNYNFELGLKRAQIVEKYLENQGINANRMITESKGKTAPVADYLTEEGRAKNRRTEISIKMK
jgi:outer membrane protein OmpA-like peptidoglycan-associated protein